MRKKLKKNREKSFMLMLVGIKKSPARRAKNFFLRGGQVGGGYLEGGVETLGRGGYLGFFCAGGGTQVWPEGGVIPPLPPPSHTYG